MEITISDISELPKIAEKIITSYPNDNVFALYGKMGAGKTTMIKEFCSYLNATDVVSSPSFAIVNEYGTQMGNPIYHFDFYRIKKLSEAYDLGYEDYFYSKNYCFIEWPEMIEELLPSPHIRIDITENDDHTRIINISEITK